jgi:hypothetical protein
MLQYIYFDDFVDAFRCRGRLNHFSEEGLYALYNYLEDVDANMHLDVIGLCCDYDELSSEELERMEDPCITVVATFKGGVIVLNS